MNNKSKRGEIMKKLLIVSPAEFNEATRLPVILPITNMDEVLARAATLFE